MWTWIHRQPEIARIVVDSIRKGAELGKESHDHWVRNQSEFEKIRAYIENNPVKAGLVRSPEEFPWSSASVEMSLDAARTSACATVSVI
jgi:hypothetical protein